jgi:hypothetical protein
LGDSKKDPVTKCRAVALLALLIKNGDIDSTARFKLATEYKRVVMQTERASGASWLISNGLSEKPWYP